MKRIIVVLSMPFQLIAIVLFFLNKGKILDDLFRYKNEVPFVKVGPAYLCYVLLSKKEFRNVFIYRLGIERLGRFVLPFTPPLETIEILTTNIGGGMRLFHKSGCTINGHSIGNNFSCGQGVTVGIGKEHNGINRPVIGNHVWIGANATVIGGISIGDYVTIGAGAVVVKDVPDHCIVVGNPAHCVEQSRVTEEDGVAVQ